MKKVLGLLLVFLMVSMLVCGCSQVNSSGKLNTDVVSSNDGWSNESKEESLDSEVYKDELKAFEDIIPIPEFEIDYAIVTSDGCNFGSVPIAKEEYEAYVKQIRGYGFTEDVVNIGDTYKANNGAGYHLWSTRLNDDTCFFSLRPEN